MNIGMFVRGNALCDNAIPTYGSVGYGLPKFSSPRPAAFWAFHRHNNGFASMGFYVFVHVS
jgi:hypothetical protein